MSNGRKLSLTLLGWFLCLTPGAFAQQAIRWEASIDAAKKAAAESNRLVLVIFTAPSWCHACRLLEADLANQPGIAAAIEANYVPVKLNVDFYQTTARQYGIASLPTTLVLAPTARGEVLDTIRGRPEMTQYITRLNQVAVDAKRRATGTFAQIPAGAGAGPTDRPVLPATVAAAPPSLAAGAGASPMAGAIGGPVVAPVSGPIGNPAAGRPSNGSPAGASIPATPAGATPAGPSSTPALGLDGFCPVQLVERVAWTPGDRRFGAIHRGRTYLFAGADEQRRFLADPDRFAPVNSGEDVVMALEQGRAVAGNRAHGVFFGNRIFLFVDEVSLEKFSKSPRYYADRALQAVQANTRSVSQVR